MKIKNIKFFVIGVLLFAFLLISYFIPVEFIEEFNIIEDSLLGVIIFHNPFVLGIYLLVIVLFILKGIRNKIF